ncbi:hypothetical protein SBOR_6202 [Sclerotinia borealis F-4128]|uniref:CFEM domain-containing protein n=1 Tax=Sclerotinia borealis (strain F-4128) TaxID=1432307 RepID=W9CF66_SCLBF|nr:hypothetical protein SBOR_6202 [Sclerotinia borealis F-4128]
MKLFAWLSLLCAVLPVSIAAETLSLIDIIQALPKCAVTCLTTAIADSTCSLTDQQCICTNVPLNTQVDECVLGSCTVKETLTTKNVTSVACNAPVRDKRELYNWISNSFVIASWLSYVARIAARFTSDTEFWWDDYMATVVMIAGIPSAVINVQGLTTNGLGKDIWTLTFQSISNMIRFFYAIELLYFAQVSFVKISILLFFLRLFPKRKIRRTIWATIVVNGMILIVFDVLAAFQCRPISFYWTRWDNEHAGVCLNINALGFTSAGVSIVMDIWMLILPMTQLYDLNLHWKKKIGVASMLGIGIIVTIVSILRLKSLILFSNTQNPTWDYVQVGYWSTIEICVGIICSSMPAMRLLLVRIFPRMSGSTNNSSNHSKSAGYDPSKRRPSVPKLSSRTSYPNRSSYAAGPGITMKKTFDVVSNHRGMAFDREIDEEEDGTELVSRLGTAGGGEDREIDEEDGAEMVGRLSTKEREMEMELEQKSSYDHLGDDLSPGLDLDQKSRKSSARSVNEGVLMSPRSPGWV